jgi:type VI secretion system secreted protein Hcp
MKRVLILAALVAVLIVGQAVVLAPANVVSAKQVTPNPSSITMVLIGLNCSTNLGGGTFVVNAYSFGANQTGGTTSGGGGGTGKAVVGDVNIVRGMDACSPVLFGAVVSGKHFTTGTLVQTDANGNTLLTMTLSDVLVSSYTISGSQQSANPGESVSISFNKICIEEASSGAKVCYDATKAT